MVAIEKLAEECRTVSDAASSKMKGSATYLSEVQEFLDSCNGFKKDQTKRNQLVSLLVSRSLLPLGPGFLPLGF